MVSVMFEPLVTGVPPTTVHGPVTVGAVSTLKPDAEAGQDKLKPLAPGAAFSCGQETPLTVIAPFWKVADRELALVSARPWLTGELAKLSGAVFE